MSSSVQALIVQAAQSAGVDPILAIEVAIQESGLNQNATGPTSPANGGPEVGVFQLLPSSFPGVNIHDLQTNITTGVGYLGELLGMFGGDVATALAAYNWGMGNVHDAQAQYGQSWFSHAPGSVQSYVATIQANMASEYEVDFSVAPESAAASETTNPGDGSVPPAGSGTSWIWVAAVAAGLLMVWGLQE